MALNFPSDTSQPYIDPASGLKYLFNGEIGGWETAIQPPVIISATPPNVVIPGMLWWDTISGRMFILYKDATSTQWVESSPGATSIVTSTGGTVPFNAVEGNIWYNTVTKRLNIYTDGEWVDIVQQIFDFYQFQKPDREVTFSHFQPRGAKRGDIWFNRSNNRVSIYSDVEGFEGWKEINVSSNIVQQTIQQQTEVPSATNETEGVVRFATQAEVNSGTGTRTAISPGALKAAIDNYVSSMETASSEEVVAGVNATKAVTPASLSGLLSVVPTGTIIKTASKAPQPGYLPCNGTLVSRFDYADLYSVIGSNFGDGDGVTTFQLPYINEPPFLNLIKY